MFWPEIIPDLKDEYEFQIQTIRSLREKYKIENEEFEFAFFRAMMIVSDLLKGDFITEEELMTLLSFLNDMTPIFNEFLEITYELENQKGEGKSG